MNTIIKTPVRTPTIELYANFKFLKIAYIRDFQHFVHLYRILCLILDADFIGYLITKGLISQRLAENGDEFCSLTFGFSISQETLPYQPLWPNNLTIFKNLLKLHLLDHPFHQQDILCFLNLPRQYTEHSFAAEVEHSSPPSQHTATASRI